ncbi:MAG: PAS domain S-box protein, partial [Candidatus Binatia bacterium]
MVAVTPTMEALRVRGSGQVQAGMREALRNKKDAALDREWPFTSSENGQEHHECPTCVANRQHQQGLRRIGHFLSATIDALSAHIAVLDGTGTIVAVNAAWRRFSKENGGTDASCGVGVSYYAVCTMASGEAAEEASAVSEGIRHVLTQRRKEFSLTYACHSDTNERWFTVRVTGFENDGVIWAVVAHEDVTALRKREEAIRQREEWFRSLSASSPIGIFQTNAAGLYVYTNPRWQEIYGLSLAESLGSGWSRAIHPKDRTDVHAEWVAAAKDRRDFCREFRIVTPGGTPRWVRVHSRPSMVDGQTVAYTGTVEDITTNKQAEEALRRSEERWHLALQGANDGIWDWNVRTNELFLSTRCKEMLGFADSEIANRFDVWATYLHPADQDRLTREINHHFAKKAQFFSTEYRLRCKDGNYKWVLARGKAVWDTAGYAVRMVGSLADITAQKHAEEQKAEFAAKVMQSNRELQEFATVASHDLQEPLRKIQTFGEQLRASYNNCLPEEGNDYLQRMLTAADRMQVLIKDLLALSRVTTRVRPMVPVDLTQVARDVVADLEVRVTQSRARVEVGLLPTIEADPLQMRQLLQNLISNALKFCRKEEAPLVRISGILSGREQHCHLRVEDNGIGFDTKYLPRIFQPFQRLHTRREYEGSGMGLT